MHAWVVNLIKFSPHFLPGLNGFPTGGRQAHGRAAATHGAKQLARWLGKACIADLGMQHCAATLLLPACMQLPQGEAPHPYIWRAMASAVDVLPVPGGP